MAPKYLRLCTAHSTWPAYWWESSTYIYLLTRLTITLQHHLAGPSSQQFVAERIGGALLLYNPFYFHHRAFRLRRSALNMPPRAVVRRKVGVDEDSEEEDGGNAALRARLAATKSKDAVRNPKANKSGKVSLSFGMDDDVDNGEDSAITIKKSKASRNISRGKLSIPDFPSSSSTTKDIHYSNNVSNSGEGNGYDRESLAALRNAQKFSISTHSHASPTSSASVDVSRETLMDQGFGIEIGGEEAELLEQKMEIESGKYEGSKSTPHSSLSSSMDEKKRMEDMYLIRNAKAQTAAWKKESSRYTDEDLSGGFTAKKEQSMQEVFAAAGGGGGIEIDEWEEELFKRGGLKIETGIVFDSIPLCSIYT